MRNKKRIISLSLGLMMMFSSLPVLGNSLLDKPLKATSSKWAKEEIVEAERYGIYNKTIYSNSLNTKLDEATKDEILLGLVEKLGFTGLPVNTDVILSDIGDPLTRGGFLRSIYNEIAKYEKVENLVKEPIMHLVHLGICRGEDGEKLFLDREITIEEAILFSKRAVDYIYNENDLAAKGLMWEIKNKGNTAYFLGSIHMAESNFYPFEYAVMDRFDNSSELYVEVDISDEDKTVETLEKMTADMTEAGSYQDDTTLKSVVGEETYAKILKILTEAGQEEEDFAKKKPYSIIPDLELAKIMMDMGEELEVEEVEENIEEVEEGSEDIEGMEAIEDIEGADIFTEGAAYGIDMFFIEKAKASGKEVKELESLEMQFEILLGSILKNQYEDLTEEEQLAKLNEIIESIENPVEVEEEATAAEEEVDLDEEAEAADLMEEMAKQVEMVKNMLAYVKEGNEEKLRVLFTEQGGLDQFGGQLLGDRDVNMAKKIAELLEAEDGKTYFIVVGAAHYVVDGMTLDNLREMGYEVTRLK